jgi:pyruvate/2-oxoglutarate dehydrogenase complex dihydrolipoamide dehydrogenase (E3) component
VAAARRLPGAREAVGDVDVDAVLARRDAFISDLDDASQAQWLGSIDADVVRGQGRLSDEREVSVTVADGSVQRLFARRAVVVATGSRASTPPVEGLADIRSWDNRDETTAKESPPACSSSAEASSGARWRRPTGVSAPVR